MVMKDAIECKVAHSWGVWMGKYAAKRKKTTSSEITNLKIAATEERRDKARKLKRKGVCRALQTKTKEKTETFPGITKYRKKI